MIDDARIRAVFYDSGEAEGRKKGYAAALRDAAEAVRRAAGWDAKPQMVNAQEAIAMIENLGLYSDE